MGNTVITVGTGPRKVLALHGWFGSANDWGPWMEVLDTQRFTYAFMDYRGYGGSQHLKGDFTLAEIAADALATADQLGWTRFSLVGHSMGGAAIQHVLAQAPQRVQALVGITPVPASGVPFDAQGRQLFDAAATDPQARRIILDLSTGNRLAGHWLDTMLARSLRGSTVDAFAAYLPAWADTDISEQLKGAQVPVKVIVGEHDPSLTEAVMRATWLRLYPHAQIEVMRNAGHYPMDETPVALATSVERFLAGVDDA